VFWRLICGVPVIPDYLGILRLMTSFGEIILLKAKMRFSLLSFSLFKSLFTLADRHENGTGCKPKCFHASRVGHIDRQS